MNVVMSTLEIVGGIVLLIACVGIIAVVALQEPPQQGGLSALTGGDSFFSQNQGRTRDELLRKVTKILAIVLFAVTIVVLTIVSRQI